MWGNYYRDAHGHLNLHAVFGHQHLERDTYIASLESRIAELEDKLQKQEVLQYA